MSGAKWSKVAPEIRDAVLARLRDAFPAAFSDERPPLRVGVHNEITERLPGIPAAELAAAMWWWTGDIRYLAGVACRHPRLGLDGQPSGEVPDEGQAGYAALTLARRTGRSAEDDLRRFHPWAARARGIAARVAASGAAEALSGGEFDFARRMLGNHARMAAPLAVGLAGVEVRPDRRGARFVALLADGTEMPFSPLECVAPAPPRPVVPMETAAAGEAGSGKESREPPRPLPAVTLEIAARAAKVSVPMRGADFAAALAAARIPEAARAAAIVLRSGEVGVGAQVAPKALLKAARQAAGAEGHVILQGRLGRRGVLEEAGLGFQPSRPPGAA